MWVTNDALDSVVSEVTSAVGLQEAAPGRRTKMPGVADNIIEGLTTNTALAPAGAGVLKQVLDAYEGQVGANEECVLAGLDPNLTRLVVGSGRIWPYVSGAPIGA